MKIKTILAISICSLAFLSGGCAKEKQELLPEATNDKISEPTNEEKATLMLADMTIDEKIGQMFFVCCPEASAVEDITTYNLGGYVLFGKDFENKTAKDVIATIDSYQKASKIPLLIGVDEEGGKVVRASKYPAFRNAPFSSPQEIFAQGGLDLVKSDTAEKSLFLKSLGINVNLAPVCDVSTNPEDFIYPRTFGQDAKNTAIYTSAVVSEMKSNKIGSVLKHFPGYGNNIDTHKEVARDSRPLEQFEAEDFLPFISAINAGADGVLVSHNVMECVDPTMPASLSAPVHKLLRENLHFNGVIMTDALAMEGVKSFSDTDAAVLAVIAGNDMIITSDTHTQVAAVAEAVKKGEISTSRLDFSVKRILVWKMELGLI